MLQEMALHHYVHGYVHGSGELDSVVIEFEKLKRGYEIGREKWEQIQEKLEVGVGGGPNIYICTLISKKPITPKSQVNC